MVGCFGTFARNESDFLGKLVTGDETWIYCYDPETKEQSKEWRQWFPQAKEVPSAKVSAEANGHSFLG